MKNKLILNVQSFKKLLIGTFFVAALFVVSSASARGGGQKSGVTLPSSAQGTLVTASQQLQTVPATTTEFNADEWKRIQASLRGRSDALATIDKVRSSRSLTDSQKEWLDLFEENALLAKKLELKQGQIVPFSQLQQQQQGEVAREGLFGHYKQYMPKTAMQGALAAGGALTAAYFAAPAVAASLTWALAAKLGAGAIAMDRIFSGLRTGALTEARAIKAIKVDFKNQLKDEGRYPTLYSQLEALTWQIEFPGADTNKNVVKVAFRELQTKLSATISLLEKSSDQGNKQERIVVDLVGKLRDACGFNSNQNFGEYVAKIEKAKEFITSNVNDNNIMPLVRAVFSEYFRMKSIVAIMKASDPQLAQQQIEDSKANPSLLESVTNWLYGEEESAVPALELPISSAATAPTAKKKKEMGELKKWLYGMYNKSHSIPAETPPVKQPVVPTPVGNPPAPAGQVVAQ